MYLMEARCCRESHGKLKGHINKLVRHMLVSLKRTLEEML